MTKQLNIQHIKDEQGNLTFVQIPYDDWVHFHKNINELIEQKYPWRCLKNAFNKKSPYQRHELIYSQFWIIRCTNQSLIRRFTQ